MQAIWNGKIIADSQATLEVDGYHYFPRTSVRMDLLKVSPPTAHDLECPHGVQFYDVTDGRQRSERSAWSYEAPGGVMKKVDHWIGFWDEVDVVRGATV
ncbi:MAG TPA: DUF427 domain-containing protein [Planctomycetota bacterium]